MNASFLMQALKATGGMVELSIKDAATPALFSAEDFKVLVTPMVWTEGKPVTANNVAGKVAVKETPEEPTQNAVAAKSTADAQDIATDVVAEAEAVIDKAAKKVKSANTQKTKGKPEIRREKAKAGKA
jgi:hypothetical protein